MSPTRREEPEQRPLDASCPGAATVSPVTTVHLALDPDADALLASDPLALVIGMVLDQQIPMERAFAAPLALQDRLGATLDARAIADADPDRLAAIFAAPPALHRFPGSMARRVQDACREIADHYDGDASRIWTDAVSGTDLVRRLRALPGFGEQKARIFAALLAKQFGARPDGWQEATDPFGEPGSFRSVADIVDDASLAAVRATKAAAKAAAKAAVGAAGSRQATATDRSTTADPSTTTGVPAGRAPAKRARAKRAPVTSAPVESGATRRAHGTR